MELHNDLIEEKIYFKELSQGMKCYVIPKKGFHLKQAAIAINYGSADNLFQKNGSVVKMPEGIAHFLEHKLFESKDINVFDRFVKQEASANAYTTFTTTAYYFSCTGNFTDNLRFLLEFVQNPHFTDENVEKEKNIIIQEIKMYNDNPGWKTYMNMMGAMYSQCPVRNEITGTAESVMRTTKNMLYECYESFYHPQNMALICAGDVDNERIFETAEKLVKKKPSPDIKRLHGTEISNPVRDRLEERMNISCPKFMLGFKDNDFTTDFAEKFAATKILLDIVCGHSSLLYERLTGSVTDSSLANDYIAGNFYGHSTFTASSTDTGAAVKGIFEELRRLKSAGISNEDFDRAKRRLIGINIRQFDSIDRIVSAQTELIEKNTDLFKMMDGIKTIDKSSVERRLHEHLDENYAVVSVIL